MLSVKYAAIFEICTPCAVIIKTFTRFGSLLVQCNNTFSLPRSFGEVAGPRPGETHYCARSNAASLDDGAVPRYRVSPNDSKSIWIFYVISKAFDIYHSVTNHICSFNQKRSLQVVNTLPPGSAIAYNYRLHRFFRSSGTDFTVESCNGQVIPNS